MPQEGHCILNQYRILIQNLRLGGATAEAVAKELLDWQNSNISTRRSSSLLWGLTAFNIYAIQMNISQKHFSEKYAYTYVTQYTIYMIKRKI